MRVRPWPTVHDAARGRARAACSGSTPQEVGRHAPAPRARGRRAARRRSSCSRATTRWWPTPNGRVAVSRGRAPALATAGTGDVLSGVIGAMLAKGLAPAHAACAGVYAHLRAGQIAAAPARARRRDRLRRDPRAARRPARKLAAHGADRARHHGRRSRVRLRGRPDRSACWRCCASTSCPASRSSTRAAAASASSPSADLILSGENEDLHLPHYFELFGGFVFLERFSHFEDRLRKAVAATAEDLMTPEPVTIEPRATVAEAARLIAAAQAQPAAGDRARPARRRRDPPRRARGAHAGANDGAGAGPGRPGRDRAQLRAARRGRGARALCAVVKADGYGHGMVPAARAAQAGGASWLAVATAEEARGLRAAGIDGPGAGDGRASPEELEVALAARADVVAWREGFVEALPPTAPRVHVKLDTRHGAARHARPRGGHAGRRGGRGRAACGSSGAMTHFATADDDPAFVAEQLAVFTPWAEALKAAHPGLLVHAANSAATLGEPAVALRPRPLRHRDLRAWTRSRTTPPTHGLEPALDARLLRRRGQARRAGPERRLRPPLRGRARRPGSARCRSATATASGAR